MRCDVLCIRLERTSYNTFHAIRKNKRHEGHGRNVAAAKTEAQKPLELGGKHISKALEETFAASGLVGALCSPL